MVAFIANPETQDLIVIYTLPDFRVACKRFVDFSISQAKYADGEDENSITFMTAAGEILKMLLLTDGRPSYDLFFFFFLHSIKNSFL